MMKKMLRKMAPRKAIILYNITCIYCGEELAPDKTTKEHVIGRSFVPKGKLNSSWNLIAKACLSCNNYKSDLEDDISAITMQPDAWGNHATDDQALALESVRKGQKSISRRTKKAVKDSAEEIRIKVQLAPNVDFTVTYTSPPIVEHSRLYDLARLQLMGFFYWITYSHETKCGGFWLGEFTPLHSAVRSDWGNPVHVSFMNTVSTWEPRVLAIGADGYFKVVIRRHPSEVCWSWGLEWNQRLRIIGFMGEREALEETLKGLPSLDMSMIPQGPNQSTGFRVEQMITDEEDRLFSIEEFEK